MRRSRTVKQRCWVSLRVRATYEWYCWQKPGFWADGEYPRRKIRERLFANLSKAALMVYTQEQPIIEDK